MNSKTSNQIDVFCHSVGDNTTSKLRIDRIYSKDTYILIYMNSGSCKIIANEKKYQLDKGCTFAVFPGVDFSINETKGCRYHWIEFSGFETVAVISRTSFSRDNPMVGIMDVSGFETLFEFPPRRGDAPYAQYRFGGFIIYLLSFYMEHFPAEKEDGNSYVNSACDFIEQRFTQQGFGVKDVVEHMKIDRTYLYRLFKNETGISIIDYIMRRRITQAEVLLSNSRLTIKDISYACGFSDQMYFSRTFRKLNGRTPTEFRAIILPKE